MLQSLVCFYISVMLRGEIHHSGDKRDKSCGFPIVQTEKRIQVLLYFVHSA